MPDWVLPVSAGVFGLLIGSFLNVVIWRVPRGQSLLPDSRCPGCGTPIRPLHNVHLISWLALRGRCARCGQRISARYPLVELLTAVAFLLVTWWYLASASSEVLLGADGIVLAVAAWLGLAAYLWFAAVGIALTAIDLEHQRLPDAIVLPSLAVVGVLLTGSAILAGNWEQLLSLLGGAAALFVLYFVIVWVYPRGMGGGDVKLAPLIGLVTGYVGWSAVAVGAFAGFLIGAIVGVALAIVRRAGRGHVIPFGPWMIAGAWVGIVAGPAVMAAYLRLAGLV